jgi:uncharacterized protein (DUF2267 family)
MEKHSFLTHVRNKGRYESSAEASRATHAVFGTIKAWLPPATADQMRRLLPVEASRLWQYSPVISNAVPSQFREGGSEVQEATLHFIFRVQQLGRYRSSREARRATCSVLGALGRILPVEPASLLPRVFPREILGVFDCRTHWAA